MIDSKAVGNKINKLRVDNKLSQDQMAEKLFVTRQAISKWELGQALPSIDSLLQMSEIFKVSFENILCLDQKPEVDPDDLFNGHSRDFIIRSIFDNKIKVNLPEVFYQFSPSERMLLIQGVKNKKIKTDIPELKAHLTKGELALLEDGQRSLTKWKI